MMKLSALNYSTWGSASMTLSNPEVTMNFTLTEEDKLEIAALALRLFEKRQPAFVIAVAEMNPQLTHIPDGDFEEVEA